ncbi:MAG: anhydro-N-acetylmuramic acid kinase [Deltaproteobacteria bacterium]|nr:anhydro-N-acetylmuramic acid kinase [Deltaproteobacteria bacterium]
MIRAIGLMSGTSADGVDIALIKINKNKIKLEAFETYSYPKKIQKNIFNALNLSLEEIAALDFELGHFFSYTVNHFLKKNKISSKNIFCIGSHGQTLFHRTTGAQDKWCTFQIGEPALIATLTGIQTVADFRPHDMALGGHGAPLTPWFHAVFFKNKKNVSVHNLGGMSNLTYLGSNSIIAFDTGPANCLLDLFMRKHTSYLFDSSGKMAARGSVYKNIVQKWMKHPYFKKAPPKSCGQDEFGSAYLEKLLKDLKGFSLEDQAATLTYFTAQTIIHAYEYFILKKNLLQEIIFCGGGVKNKTLMHFIQEGLKKYAVQFSTFDKYGISSQAVEAVSFALMGVYCLKKKSNHLPRTTGASRKTILGKISYP